MRRAAHFLFIVLTASLAVGAAATEPSGERYSLRSDNWESGGGIRPKIADNSAVPFEKTYRELTPAQQDYLRSLYEGMGPDDEPPYPINGLKPIVLQIVKAVQTLNVDGLLTVFVQVDSQGKAQSVTVVHSPDPRMSQMAAGILMFETYKPARCDGKPCAMQFPFRFDLKLRR